MTQLQRVRVEITGGPIGVGVATFYSLGNATVVDSLHSLWTHLATMMPTSVRIQVPNVGDTIDEGTGDIVGQWLSPPVESISGGASGVYAAPVGAALTWHTDGIVHSHRLRGRTFVVPLIGNAYSADGTLDDSARTAIAALAADYVAEQSADFVIWSRPFKGTPAVGTRKANPARVGSHALVTSSSVDDRGVVLRSRRA